MKKEHIDNVAAGFTVLINEELASESPLRFRRAANLCAQAATLVQTNALRVAEVDDDDAMGVGYGIPGALPMGGVGRRMAGIGRIRNEGADTGGILREAIHVLRPMLDAQQAKVEEGRLSKLLSIRARLKEADRPTDAIDKRIDAALEDLDTNKETTDAKPVMDAPLVLRRPAPGEDRPDDDAPDHGEGDGVGEEGPGEAADRCA